MALAVRAAVVGGTTTGTSTTIAMTIPVSGTGGTVVAGDVGIACFESAGSQTVSSAPSGWTQREITTNAQLNITGCIYTKTLVAGDINTPLTWTLSSGTNLTGSIDVLSGADESSFVYTAWTVGTGTGSTNTTVVVPTNGWILGFWMGGITTAGAAFTFTKPASYTLLSTRATSIVSGTNHAQGTAFLSVPAGGSTAGSACTFSVATARNAAYSIGVAAAVANVTITGVTAGITLAAPAGFVNAPTWVAGASANDGSTALTTTAALTVPAGAAANQTALVTLSCLSATATVTTTPPGWTLLSGPDRGTTFSSWLYARPLAAADVGQSFSWVLSTSVRFVAVMDVYSGQGAVGVPVFKTVNSVTTLVDAALTATTTGSLIYVAWSGRSASATPCALTFPASPTYTADETAATNASVNDTVKSGQYGPVTAGAVGGNTGSSSPQAATAAYYAAEIIPGATLVGPVAAVTVAAPAGSLSISVALAGAVAGITLAAPSGAFTSAVAVTGAVGNAAITAPTGTVAASADTAGALSAITFAAPAGTPVIAEPGPVSATTFAASAGTVSSGATLAGSTVGSSLAAFAGTITANATLSGAAASATTAAFAGSVDTAGSTDVAGQIAAVTFAALTGAVSSNVGIAGQGTALTAAALPGTVHGSVAIPGVPAQVSVAAPPGAALTVTSVTIAGLEAAMVIAAPAGQTIQPRDITVTAGAPSTAWTATDAQGSRYAAGGATTALATGDATTRYETGTPNAKWATGDPA